MNLLVTIVVTLDELHHNGVEFELVVDGQKAPKIQEAHIQK